MGQWKTIRIFIIAVVVFSALWHVYPTLRLYWPYWPFSQMPLPDEERAQLQDRAIKLGLDLLGGVHIVLEVDKTGLPPEEEKDVLDRAMQVISNRINEFGVAEPIIQREGDSRIIVELPGIKDVNRAIGLINQTAQLEFKMVREEDELHTLIERIDALLAARSETTGDTSQIPLITEQTQSRPFSLLIDHTGGELRVPAVNIDRVTEILGRPEVRAFIPDGTELLPGMRIEDINGQQFQSFYYVNATPELTGAVLEDAWPEAGSAANLQSAGRAVVGFTTTDDGARTFARVTGNNIGKRLAIVLDGRVFSAPTIQGRIPNGRGEITGIGSLEEARDLAIVLRAGALPASMDIVKKQVVGPSLGADAIRSGVQAAVLGLILVVLFMWGYYRTSGLIANFALGLNMVLLLAVMAGFQATLTLPGIAGIILTMGMAVDANILIFERIKEEIRAGNKSIRQAIDSGYDNALRTIVDANITTLITALALYQFGTGPIKGFAVTLSVGLVISMFTAIMVTRALYDGLVDRWHVENLSIGKADPFGRVNFGFMKFGRAAFAITWSVILIGFISIGMRGGIKWGVDFQGGSLLEVHFNPPVSVEEIRSAMRAVSVDGQTINLSQSEIKEFGSSNNILIRAAAGSLDEQTVAAAIKTTLKEKFPQQLEGEEEEWLRQEENVWPKIGKELTVDAVKAVMWSILGIVAYIGVRFRHVGGMRFGIGTITALVHDVLIVIALFSLINEEISMAVVAALLTVVGYSTNDTIVVFDRIREGLRKARREPFPVVVDRSINETLNRTMMTSLTVMLVLVLLLAGSESTNWGFALALTFGVITGTYSSIFVASPIVVWWQNWVTRKREKMRQSRSGSPKSKSSKQVASQKVATPQEITG